MKTIRVHDQAIVLVLTKKEAEALDRLLQQQTKKSKALFKAEEKLAVELMYI